MFAFLIHFLVMTGIFAIAALSLNFQVGLTGLSNFGQAAFMMIGAYTSALMYMAGAPFIVGVLAGMVVSAVFALIIALPSQNLRADYWAIVSIAAAESLRLFINNEKWLAEGPFGLRGIPRPLSSLFGDYYTVFYLFLVLACLALVYFALERLNKAPFGRVLRGLRETEDLMEALGKHVFRFKALAMIIGGLVAALSGSLYAHYITFVSPQSFAPDVTFLIWTMMIVGGSGNAKGVIVGALVITLLNTSTRLLKDYVYLPTSLVAALRTLSIGLLTIVFVVSRPQGVLPERKQVVSYASKEGGN
ncbi:MAG: branched-chain amino acid ABC transporter permease [Anaerolineae bacterium]|nr:branched-chain amino acid ABC transporter permease [Anaerolineae bacterium]